MVKNLFSLFDIEYEVSITGEVLNKTEGTSPPIVRLKEGTYQICLFDNDKLLNINYGLFLLAAYNRFFLPFELWDEVDVDFLDGDTTNYHLENIYLVYKNGPIELNVLDNFYYVPGLELNAINEKGLIYRIPQSDIQFPIFIKGGTEVGERYPHYRVNINDGRVSDRFVHKLLALTFLEPPKNYPIMAVNHKNGNKDDFALNNLEWVTSSENNIHAFKEGLRTDNKPIQIKDVTNGEIRTYFSLGEAARQLNTNPGAISSVISGKTNMYLKRYLIRRLGDETSWEDLENKVRNNTISPVKVRNVLTGEVINYSSVREACLKNKVHTTTALRQINNPKEPRVILNGFEFKHQSDLSAWHNFTIYDIEVFKRGLPPNTPVYSLKNIETGEEVIHYGWKSVNEVTGVVKRTIFMVSKRNGMVNKKYQLNKLK